MRIRNRGHADVTFKATSYAEAEQAILRIESERRVGLFIDYSRAQKTTLARLFERYIQEECPKHKGCAIETYTLKGFLSDSRNELAEALAERERSLAAGHAAPSITGHRDLRCLSRYTNLCASKLATTLDEVFAAAAMREQNISRPSAIPSAPMANNSPPSAAATEVTI